MNSNTIFHHFIPLYLLLTIPTSFQQHISFVDRSALLRLTYTLTDVKPGTFFSTWSFNHSDICSSFTGVTCSLISNELRVTSLSLGTGLSDSPGLAGTISNSLYQLTELTQLILFPGFVTGFIPQKLGRKCKHLRVISLTNNQLTGNIPESLSELKELHTLDLSHNRLTGVIPGSMTLLLPELKVLVLAYNKLVGKLPEFFSESEMIHLDVSHNKLTGELPEKMPVKLRYLSLSSNGLRGPLDGVLGSLSYLVYLDLSMNKFSGPVPVMLLKGTITSMYLQRNNLSGQIQSPSTSPNFVPYAAGSTIDLSHNFLSGKIPDFLNGVETLFLNYNHFTGNVPKSYVDSVFAGTIRTLYLQHNYITDFPVEDRRELVLPDGVALCLSYNCMVPPGVGLTACPASAGRLVSRPFRQCSALQ